MTTRFDSKDPSEIVTVKFEFGKLGIPNDAQVTITVRTGTDPEAGNMLLGPPEYQGTAVLQQVSGGADGCDYALRCLADVAGDRLLIDAVLPVRARPTPGG